MFAHCLIAIFQVHLVSQLPLELDGLLIITHATLIVAEWSSWHQSEDSFTGFHPFFYHWLL